MDAKIGISQSMIAKIESNKLDPTYSYVKKIESSLNSLSQEKEKQAKDIMIHKIISARPNTKVEEIIKIMNKYSISQVPVIQGKNVLGLVTESSILSKNQEDLKKSEAKDIMQEAPPIISKNATLEVIKQLLRYYPCLLIKDPGNIVGIITKADLLKNLS